MESKIRQAVQNSISRRYAGAYAAYATEYAQWILDGANGNPPAHVGISMALAIEIGMNVRAAIRFVCAVA